MGLGGIEAWARHDSDEFRSSSARLCKRGSLDEKEGGNLFNAVHAGGAVEHTTEIDGAVVRVRRDGKGVIVSRQFEAGVQDLVALRDGYLDLAGRSAIGPWSAFQSLHEADVPGRLRSSIMTQLPRELLCQGKGVGLQFDAPGQIGGEGNVP